MSFDWPKVTQTPNDEIPAARGVREGDKVFKE